MGLKGGRSIVVRDFRFKWKACHPSVCLGDSTARYMDIIVHADEGGGKLRAKIASDLWDEAKEHDYENCFEKHAASLTPADVRLVIEKAMDDGWDWMDKGPQHELVGPLNLNHYSVRMA